MSEQKLCPFRKHHEASGPYPPPPWDDELAPCLEAKCAMWRKVVASTEYVNNEVVSQTWLEFCGLSRRS